MKLLYFEAEAWRADAVRQALFEILGTRVELNLATTLGQCFDLLTGRPDAVALSASAPGLGPRESGLLSWYLSRRLPEASLWIFAGPSDDTDDSAPTLSDGLAVQRIALPVDPQGYRDWVERFRRHHRLDYQTGTLPISWWRTRRWLVADQDGQEVASHLIEDPALMSDLLAFLRLKAGQMVDALGAERWRNFALSSPDLELEIAALGPDHAVISLDDGLDAQSDPPPEATLELLDKRGVITPCR
jgi:hypothetical protein